MSNCPLCEILSAQVDALKQKVEELEKKLAAQSSGELYLSGAVRDETQVQRELYLNGGMER